MMLLALTLFLYRFQCKAFFSYWGDPVDRGEGGLNLSMPASRIRALAGYGKDAGKEFGRRFGDCSHFPGLQPENKMNWESHQLIRLHSLIGSLSEMLLHLKQGNDAVSANPDQGYARFFTPEALGPASYRFQRRNQHDSPGQPYWSQARLAEHILDDLLALAIEIETAKLLPGGSSTDPEHKTPKPPPELKLKPRI